MSFEARGYRSYLLRLWHVKDEDAGTWRASLESPLTGERWGFAGLEEMYVFLCRQIGLVPYMRDAEEDEIDGSEQGGQP